MICFCPQTAADGFQNTYVYCFQNKTGEDVTVGVGNDCWYSVSTAENAIHQFKLVSEFGYILACMHPVMIRNVNDIAQLRPIPPGAEPVYDWNAINTNNLIGAVTLPYAWNFRN